MDSTSTPIDISVVIVAWNARKYLELCLQSVEETLPRRRTEVLVVDNASVDGSPEMVETRFPLVKLIRSGDNLGFAKGNNLALQQCRGRYIALVNPDVVVLPGCLDALADFLDKNPDVGNVGPRVFYPDMSQQSTCRRFPTLWNNFCSATGLATTFRNSRLFAGEHMFYFPHDRTQAVNVLVGCFWMMRREAVVTVGGLDEGFFMYGEDVDWCRRCWKSGWQVVFFPGAQAIHYGGRSAAGDPVRFAVVQLRSVLRFWHMHHGFCGRLGIRSIMLFHHLLRYTFAVLSGRGHPQRRKESDAQKKVSGACLRELLFGRIPQGT
jgi:GT2 family glycosyltransferase